MRKFARLLVRHEALIRLLFFAAAVAVLIIRKPGSFGYPQFWAEDGTIFFHRSSTFGWVSLVMPAAGYLCFAPQLIALLANLFPVSWAPWLFFYTSVGCTLAVVWLAGSKRFPLKSRYLMPLIIVATPHMFELLGGLANSMWILPVGAFVILFMRSSTSRLVLWAETIFIFLTMFTGPFSIFLTPLFILRMLALRHAPQDFRRMFILTAVAVTGGITELVYIFSDPAVAGYIGSVEAEKAGWITWVALPLSKILGVFGPRFGALAVSSQLTICLAVLTVAVLVLRRKHRPLKIAMLYFGMILIFSAMWKYRSHLSSLQHFGTQRYFFIAGIFFVWVISLNIRTFRLRTFFGIGTIALMLASFPVEKAHATVLRDKQWNVWSKWVEKGLSPFVPINPKDWYIFFPVNPQYPQTIAFKLLGKDIILTSAYHIGDVSGIQKYRSYLGKKLDDSGVKYISDFCFGTFDAVERVVDVASLNENYWQLSGRYSRNTHVAKSAELIVITDEHEVVRGFGFPGFRDKQGKNEKSEEVQGWRGAAMSAPGTKLKAYFLSTTDNSICRIRHEHHILQKNLALLSGGYSGTPVPITGNNRITMQLPAVGDFVHGIYVTFATGGKVSSKYTIQWVLKALNGKQSEIVGRGNLAASDILDWESVKLEVQRDSLIKPNFFELEISALAAEQVVSPVYLPLYHSKSTSTDNAVKINGVALVGRILNVDLDFGKRD